MYRKYRSRLENVDAMADPDDMWEVMEKELRELEEDGNFIKKNLKKVKEECQKKSVLQTTSQKKLKELFWGVHENEVVGEQIVEAKATLKSFQEQIRSAVSVCTFNIDFL